MELLGSKGVLVRSDIPVEVHHAPFSTVSTNRLQLRLNIVLRAK